MWVLALDILTTALLTLGCLVALTGAAGVLRFPDFYSRLHAAGKTDSLAQVFIMTGLLLQAHKYPGLELGAGVRLVFITLFIVFTSPVATHAITKAAHLHGLKPWTKDGEPRA
jgi:multicomponent Na+:H+ antiporter subunit G